MATNMGKITMEVSVETKKRMDAFEDKLNQIQTAQESLNRAAGAMALWGIILIGLLLGFIAWSEWSYRSSGGFAAPVQTDGDAP